MDKNILTFSQYRVHDVSEEIGWNEWRMSFEIRSTLGLFMIVVSILGIFYGIKRTSDESESGLCYQFMDSIWALVHTLNTVIMELIEAIAPT